ncbi:MAG: hypothetical protein QOI19_576 [Thermoleophilaceae bacterium]|nr:hypothetical protein [Thermoleophilaceae bacterium]
MFNLAEVASSAPVVPSEVLKLAYLEREIQLRSQAGRQTDFQAALRSLRATWRKMRPWLIQAGGAREAIAYDAHVRALRAGGKPSGSAKGLDLVDKMEGVFLGR